MRLKLVSWNIWGGKHLDGIIAFLKDADADIIALQEVIKDGFEGNTAATIARALGYNYSQELGMRISSNWTGPAREKEERIDFGNALLSKHDIIHGQPLLLSEPERRTAIRAEIRVGDAIINAFSIHLRHQHVQNPLPEIDALQKQQITTLCAMLSPKKTVVMGDFNGTPQSYSVRTMRELLRDTEGSNATPTWSNYPEGCDICNPDGVQYKFDYIFTSPDIRAQSCVVNSSMASDHLPISAVVEYN